MHENDHILKFVYIQHINTIHSTHTTYTSWQTPNQGMFHTLLSTIQNENRRKTILEFAWFQPIKQSRAWLTSWQVFSFHIVLRISLCFKHVLGQMKGIYTGQYQNSPKLMFGRRAHSRKKMNRYIKVKKLLHNRQTMWLNCFLLLHPKYSRSI